MGGLKYLSVISIPLIYYLFPFQGYFGDILFPILISSPLIYSTIYVLIFSATRQVGAVLFGLTFWFASGLVHDDRVRRSVLASSIGITILFSTVALTPLRYAVYPPYGMITQAFIPLGAYLLFVGIFTSAIHISRDAAIRRELYKSAMSQLDLLRSIGTSEMEKEFEFKVRLIEKETTISNEAEVPELKEDQVREILREVLDELYGKEK
jgi:hypothetical protein